ncbi:hypothetical protein CANMA_001327 [Candida margitis]|uniref:uncharacterized protein n=1 Tax=Candida margitis TaxID=1775924 RepID=UPI00222776A3|nr:uncharacterized protein CANMA_001327 [Candida margitis]KAI5969664.1 hypothetical protein CANMA_001327 [Candida margitis]
MSFSNNLLEHENLLSSLSLEDNSERIWSAPALPRTFEEIDDPMDIDDDPMDIDDTINATLDEDASTQRQSVKDEEDDSHEYRGDEEHHHQNLLALLSPTMMGARLAITHKPKLLMPPSPKADKTEVLESQAYEEALPYNVRKHSIDYEFDISSFPTIKNSNSVAFKRNISTFNDITNTNPSASFSGNHVNTSSNEFSNPNPIQHQAQMIHHHHYYINGGGEDQLRLERMRRSYIDQLEINKLREEELDRHLAMQKPEPTELTQRTDYINLPAPWRQDIHPIEKVPYIISSYLQLFINVIISLYFVYLVYYIITSIKSDVNHKIQAQKRAIQAQIDSCRTLFYESKCDDPEFNTLPILRKKCEALSRGMNQDPNSIGNLSMINAQIIGLILNSLVEPLGFKFFVFLLWCGIVVFGCNFVFGFVRARTYYGGQMDGERLNRKNE